MPPIAGYFLIIIGALCIAGGVALLRQQPKEAARVERSEIPPMRDKVEQPAPQQHGTSSPLSEAKSRDSGTLSPKEKGDSFERYVVRNFNPNYFTLQEWRGDKYVDGVYPVSNHFPDLEIVFSLPSRNIKDTFAIECKWRSGWHRNNIEWASDFQVAHYKEYAQRVGIPVFVVIGLGGTPDAPEHVYCIPLEAMQGNTLTFEDVRPYWKKIAERTAFYWDSESRMLR
jgi:hypothetical protein